jgi:hypothetical protein
MVDDLKARVIESLREFTTSLNGECPEIEDDMTMDDLGLSSQDGIAWACELETLGIVIPDKLNPFWDDKKRRERNIREIVRFSRHHAGASEKTKKEKR